MSPVSFRGLASENLSRAGQFLFTPFSFSRWLRLAVVAMLAGALGGGGCGIQSFRNLNPKQEAPERVWRSDSQTAADASNAVEQKAREAVKTRYQFVDSIFRPDPSRYPKISKLWLAAVLIPFLILLLLAVAVFWFAMLWLSVRFKFVWLRAVTEGESSIKVLFRRCASEADELFNFWLNLSLLELASYGAALAWLVGAVVSASGGWGHRLSWAPETAFAIVGPPLGALALVWVIFSVARVVGDDFLVPMSLRFPGSSKDTWARWVALYRQNRPAVWRYLLLRFWFAGCWVTGSMIVMVLFIVLWVLALGLCFVLFGLAQKVWAGLKAFYIFYTLLVGGPLLIVLFVGIVMILLPGAVFFRMYSIGALNRLIPPSETSA